ncbi:MAG: InlB B-repeat-containing protein [Spirochaetaceae bacterium]|nr:InlB B-repeat-containing protein [Spirochaetaceae bacterium]
MKKQEKKLVLAGLVLLAAITMVLLPLAGCKKDTVPEPTRYTVKFETDHGTAPDDITVVSGTKLTAEQLKVLDSTDNYIFEYWYDKDVDAQKPVEEGYTVTKDVTLVAKWRDRGTVASVNFSPAGGTKFYCDESIAVSLTSEEGATIQYKLGDGSWKDYDADTTISITGDTTITAKATKEGLKPSETTATYTVRKLEGITVTSPTRTVYSVGQSFDHTGMVVTATYDDKSQREVTGWETDFNTVAGEKGLNKPVTVSYKEGEITKTTTFTVDVASYEFTETVQDVDSSYAGTMTGGNYKKFGDWPQIIKKEGVEIGAGTLVRGGLTYHVGSDGNYYVKITAKPYEDTYTYSDGNPVEKSKEVYFKVEPIVWRVLTENYNSTNHALLLAESILTGGIKWADSKNDYMESNIRKWLNGNSGTGENSDYSGTPGFLQTAFTADAQSLIAETEVDNSAASTNTESNPSQWNGGTNQYACGDTTDKVFLLSEKEATTSGYGFAEYNVYVGDNDGTTTSTRIRVTTDYAKATGANQSSTEGYGDGWWLRSPDCDYGNNVRGIDDDGNANYYYIVFSTRGGVVPALSISLGGN